MPRLVGETWVESAGGQEPAVEHSYRKQRLQRRGIRVAEFEDRDGGMSHKF